MTITAPAPTAHGTTAADLPAFCACLTCSALFFDTEGGAHAGPAISEQEERVRVIRRSASGSPRTHRA